MLSTGNTESKLCLDEQVNTLEDLSIDIRCPIQSKLNKSAEDNLIKYRVNVDFRVHKKCEDEYNLNLKTLESS